VVRCVGSRRKARRVRWARWRICSLAAIRYRKKVVLKPLAPRRKCVICIETAPPPTAVSNAAIYLFPKYLLLRIIIKSNTVNYHNYHRKVVTTHCQGIGRVTVPGTSALDALVSVSDSCNLPTRLMAEKPEAIRALKPLPTMMLPATWRTQRDTLTSYHVVIFVIIYTHDMQNGICTTPTHNCRPSDLCVD